MRADPATGHGSSEQERSPEAMEARTLALVERATVVAHELDAQSRLLRETLAALREELFGSGDGGKGREDGSGDDSG